MNRKIGIYLFLLFIGGLGLGSCCKKTAEPKPADKETTAKSGPPVIIYKTTKDYSQFVPVILSEDKKSIISFPDVRDVFYKGQLAYPTPLKQGFLLDNRGIGPQVAFLDYTYKVYANFKSTPTVEELQKHILDSSPLTEMYHCGSRYDFNDLVNELNTVIEAGTLYKYKKIY
jgi:hypothetical protein